MHPSSLGRHQGCPLPDTKRHTLYHARLGVLRTAVRLGVRHMLERRTAEAGPGVLPSAEMERRYGAAEKALVEDLARRAALAIENARLYREARQAIQVRNEFLATISHDLANPLSVIRGQVQLYQQRAARACVADRAWLLDGVARIDTSTMKAIGMIGQLLDVAHLQSGRSLEL